MTDSSLKLKVLKKLSPNQPGALKLARRYGKALVCVRHRTDPKGQFRYTTVELLVEKSVVRQRVGRMVQIKIDFRDAPLRSLLQAAGATWDANSKLWTISRRAAAALNLLDRVVQK